MDLKYLTLIAGVVAISLIAASVCMYSMVLNAADPETQVYIMKVSAGIQFTCGFVVIMVLLFMFMQYQMENKKSTEECFHLGN